MPKTKKAVSTGMSAAGQLGLYRTMLRIRLFENCLAGLVEHGEVKTPCHLYVGQEAIAAGVCAALKKSDCVWGNHRSHGHFLAKGGKMRPLMAEIFGKKSGCCGGRGGSMHVICREEGVAGTVPIVAATIPLAVGNALANKLKNTKDVAVAFFGDGATEEGHFQESVNLAALYKLPAVFVCENNMYASHLGVLERRVENNLHEFGNVYRMNSVRTDGNDVLGVYETTLEAVARARKGKGPSFLEFMTYRWYGHVGHRRDMDVGVKRKAELEDWFRKDPVLLAKNALEKSGVSVSKLDGIEEQVKAEVADALAFARKEPYPETREVSEHVYAGRVK
ncbi:MAG: thiamine pyrophosphate-dependent dehydrogenase E1 component subunit alpha [Elusimicrobiales bacterium]|nr:thiamine pyrophosphate-dependent dehydrogenase E1 component subunit alpha [Elusimicrobiales bacterium]